MKRFKNTDLASTIEARSKESASSGTISWTKSERWIHSEWLVARELCAQGLELLEHRWKTPFAEIDLLFQEGRERLLIVEVKSWNESLYGDFGAREILTARQGRRLERARLFVEAQSAQSVRLLIAVVSHCASRSPAIHLFDPPNVERGY